MKQMVFTLASMLFCTAVAIADQGKPNVIVILADDQGWGDLSLSMETPT